MRGEVFVVEVLSAFNNDGVEVPIGVFVVEVLSAVFVVEVLSGVFVVEVSSRCNHCHWISSRGSCACNNDRDCSRSMTIKTVVPLTLKGIGILTRRGA